MKKIRMILSVLAIVLGLSANSQATLTTIGTATYNSSEYKLIYDDDLGIVWFDYSNAYNFWSNQVDWASGLNTPGILTYNINTGVTVTWIGEWRLPSTVDGFLVNGYKGPESDGTYSYTAGWNLYNSEMGHLYYEELQNLGYVDTSDAYVGDGNWGLLKTGEFDNLNSDIYWSGNEYSSYSYLGWCFLTFNGLQTIEGKIADHQYGLAVRPADVSFVPEPSTILLLGFGLAGVGLFRRKSMK